MATPRAGISKSERARQMYADGERDNKVIAERCGLSVSAVWCALRARQISTVSEPGGPTFFEREIAMRLATMRGTPLERADEIAKELAKARNGAREGRAA